MVYQTNKQAPGRAYALMVAHYLHVLRTDAGL